MMKTFHISWMEMIRLLDAYSLLSCWICTTHWINYNHCSPGLKEDDVFITSIRTGWLLILSDIILRVSVLLLMVIIIISKGRLLSFKSVGIACT